MMGYGGRPAQHGLKPVELHGDASPPPHLAEAERTKNAREAEADTLPPAMPRHANTEGQRQCGVESGDAGR